MNDQQMLEHAFSRHGLLLGKQVVQMLSPDAVAQEVRRMHTALHLRHTCSHEHDD